MVNSKYLHNVTIPFPIVESLTHAPLMNMVEIKSIYQQWNGESIEQIKHKAKENPYNIRIGLPRVDEQLKNDPKYFVLGYLSYNPITKDIESREIVSYRNMNKVYIGQSPDEYRFNNFKLFVDGNVVAKDYILSNDNASVGQMINHLIRKVEKLQDDVAYLKAQLKNETIYK